MVVQHAGQLGRIVLQDLELRRIQLSEGVVGGREHHVRSTVEAATTFTAGISGPRSPY